MIYEIFGPFDVIKAGRLVDRRPASKQTFWAGVDAQVSGLSDAVGCYIFCIGNKPWYVGLAEKQSFRSECFQPHKINAFNSGLDMAKKGKPSLIFLSKVTSTGRFAKVGVNGHKSSRVLEDMLIGMALANNPLLENILGTKFLKELVVPGLINTPQGKGRAKSVQALKQVLNRY